MPPSTASAENRPGPLPSGLRAYRERVHPYLAGLRRHRAQARPQLGELPYRGAADPFDFRPHRRPYTAKHVIVQKCRGRSPATFEDSRTQCAISSLPVKRCRVPAMSPRPGRGEGIPLAPRRASGRAETFRLRPIWCSALIYDVLEEQRDRNLPVSDAATLHGSSSPECLNLYGIIEISWPWPAIPSGRPISPSSPTTLLDRVAPASACAHRASGGRRAPWARRKSTIIPWSAYPATFRRSTRLPRPKWPGRAGQDPIASTWWCRRSAELAIGRAYRTCACLPFTAGILHSDRAQESDRRSEIPYTLATLHRALELDDVHPPISGVTEGSPRSGCSPQCRSRPLPDRSLRRGVATSCGSGRPSPGPERAAERHSRSLAVADESPPSRC